MRVLAIAAAVLVAASALAAAPSARAGRLVDLAVVDRDTGQTLRTWSHDGRLYVAGTPGHRYAVRLSNRSGGRVMTVLSVDGVNAVTGETASPDQSGYVLDPYESTEINGWRKSLDEIAEFNFTALPESYAARTGRPANVGVIGVAVFTERAPVWRERDEIAEGERRDARPAANAEPESAADAARPAPMPAQSAAAGSARALAKSEEKLGTGHGAREISHVSTTAFERATRWPNERLAVWYDSYRNLVAAGVISRPIARRDPDPFPNGFVPDPPAR